jgi:hypothetical protein
MQGAPCNPRCTATTLTASHHHSHTGGLGPQPPEESILVKRLKTSIGLHDPLLSWFQSNLLDWSQCLRRRALRSLLSQPNCSTTHGGSIPGQISFILYLVNLAGLIERYGLRSNPFADETQLLFDDRCCWNSTTAGCMHIRHDNLDACKSSAAQHGQIWAAVLHFAMTTASTTIGIEPKFITPSATVCDLGMLLDSDLTLQPQIQKIVDRCSSKLRHLGSVHRSIAAPFQHLFLCCSGNITAWLRRCDTGRSWSIAQLLATVSLWHSPSFNPAGLHASNHITDK